MSITFSHKGDFSNTIKFLNKLQKKSYRNILERYGRIGVEALRAATPVNTGLAASSWYFDIEDNGETSTLSWGNSDIEGGCNVAILIDKGHATKSGTWVPGYNFIEPTLDPILEQLKDAVWKEYMS